MTKRIEAWKSLLDPLAEKFESPQFIEFAPIQIPRQFERKEDIEIAGFLAASIAWGNRKSIISNAQRMMSLMDHAPHDFILDFGKADEKRFSEFVHRTFNSVDLVFFLRALKHIYKNHGGMESAFQADFDGVDIRSAIMGFRARFFELKHDVRTQKHVSNPLSGSAAKRLNMYLRWMVRSNLRGVDLGLWQSIPTSALSIPLDVHSGRVARQLGMLKRQQDDWKAVAELDSVLRKMDPKDPVKYDFALFGSAVMD
ncbi:MAG: TIGR02757 family protein [Flavobacteriales bacterium]